MDARDRSACFTGHRPEKLNRPELEIRQEIKNAICQAFADGIEIFISGMAPGVDIWAAEMVIELRDSGVPIKLIVAIPYPGFENRWPEWKDRYAAIMAAADLAQEICPHYHRGCYQIRNRWLVDHSSRVIAVCNGSPGGTKNTIAYAIRKGVPIVCIEG